MSRTGAELFNTRRLIVGRVDSARSRGLLPPAKGAATPSARPAPSTEAAQPMPIAESHPPEAAAESEAARRKEKRARKKARGEKRSRASSGAEVLDGMSRDKFFAPGVDICQHLGSITPAGKEYLLSVEPAERWRHMCELSVRLMAMGQIAVQHPQEEAARLRAEMEGLRKHLAQQTSMIRSLAEERDGLVKEVEGLKVVGLKKDEDHHAELARVRGELKADLDQLKSDHAAFQDLAQEKAAEAHVNGFKQAVRQAKYFGRFPEGFEFDISRDFYRGTLMLYADMPEDVEADEDIPLPESSDQADQADQADRAEEVASDASAHDQD